MPEQTHVHLSWEWNDKTLANDDTVSVEVATLNIYVAHAEIHDWRYDGGDAEYAKWLALQNETEGDGGEVEG